MKQLTRYEMAAVKRTAQNTKMLKKQLAKLEAKRNEIDVQITDLEEQINTWEAPIVSKWGYDSEYIISLNGELPEDVDSSCEEEKPFEDEAPVAPQEFGFPMSDNENM